MRVLLISGSYPPDACGVGDYTMRLARVLAQQPGWEVAVLTGPTTPGGASGNVADAAPAPVVMHCPGAWSFSALPQIVAAVRRWAPDIVHFQYPTQGFFGWRLPALLPVLLRCLGFPSVQTWHEPPPTGVRAMVYFLLPRLGAQALVFVRPGYLDTYFPPWLKRWVAALPHATIQNTAALPLCSLDASERTALRSRWLGGRQRLIVFFGFVTRHKGVEQIFDIANPETDVVVVAGRTVDAAYVDELQETAMDRGWADNVVFPGFLEPGDAAALLAVADAVVLPFVEGGGVWNTSIHSAVAQGTLVITTGADALGDDPKRNLYVAAPGEVAEMRMTLDRLAGRKTLPASQSGWQDIANAHLGLYGRCLRPLGGEW